MLIIGLEIITMEDCSVCLELDTNKDERNVPANQMNSSISNEKLSNPWPKLEKFYFFKSIRNQNLQFEFILCRPKEVSISTCTTWHSNLRKRVMVSVTCISFTVYTHVYVDLMYRSMCNLRQKNYINISITRVQVDSTLKLV